MPAARGAIKTAGSALLGLLLAAVVLCAGTLSGGALREKAVDLTARQAFSQEGARGEQGKELRRRTVSLLGQYVFALADAAIQFDAVPKFDALAVYEIAAAMPPDMKITGMAFDGYNLVLSCAAPEAAVQAFCARLREGGGFAEISAEAGLAQDELPVFYITCAPNIQEGQLALTPRDDGET